MESKPWTHSHNERQQQQQRRGGGGGGGGGGLMKKSSSGNSESSNLDSPHSPLRFHSPLRSEAGDPPETPPYESPANSLEPPLDNSRAIVALEKPNSLGHHHKKAADAAAKTGPGSVILNRAVREDAPPSVAKVGPVAGGNGAAEYGDGGGGGRRSNYGSSPPAGRKPRSEHVLSNAALGFRISEFVLCLISFSVMAADKTQGWSGDSFDRYKEYRYCLCVNIIAFVYSIFQAYDLAYYLVTGKHVIKHHLRRHFELFMDQILAYLLISAASSAATRVDDWQSNWGKDEFTKMASASVVMAFLAFGAFAISSLISGYNLWTESSV